MYIFLSENIATLNPEKNSAPKKVEKAKDSTDLQDGSNPQSLPKFLDEDNFVSAQKRVQFLLSKLHNLLQIKVDLDQLLALTQEFGEATNSLSKGGSKAYQQVTQEIYFKVAVERLMKKGRILELNQDVQLLLSRLRQLVQFQAYDMTKSSTFMQIYCDDKSLNPLHSKIAFLHFITGRLDYYNVKFSCKDSTLKVTPSSQTDEL